MKMPLVGELVERTTALQIEARVVPVAGQDAVSQGAPVQGEAHVGTAVVHGAYPAFVEEERERVPGYPDGGAICGAYVLQTGGPHEVIRDGIPWRSPFAPTRYFMTRTVWSPDPLSLSCSLLDFWVHAVCCAQTMRDRGRSICVVTSSLCSISSHP
jgi:hypothetical protein